MSFKGTVETYQPVRHVHEKDDDVDDDDAEDDYRRQ